MLLIDLRDLVYLNTRESSLFNPLSPIASVLRDLLSLRTLARGESKSKGGQPQGASAEGIKSKSLKEASRKAPAQRGLKKLKE
jgi:hypothetical protein